MATTGFRFPTTDAAVSGSWTNATNVQADDGAVAVCNIAAKNTTGVREQGGFGFSTAVLPDAATITQVNLRVEWRVQTNASVIAFLGARARVTTTDLTLHENAAEPITLTVETFDITAERAWTPADFRDGTFKTRLQGRNGNDASDPGYEFDYVAVEVVYSVSSPVTVTPDTASLTTATFAPTVTASDNKTVTPGTVALTTATFAPTVTATANQLVTPGTASLTLATFAPTVTGGSGTTVTPGTASLTTTGFAPTVSITDHKTVTPGVVALSVSTFAPTVTATANQLVTPDTATLTLTGYAPTVQAYGEEEVEYASGTSKGTRKRIKKPLRYSDVEAYAETVPENLTPSPPEIVLGGSVVEKPRPIVPALAEKLYLSQRKQQRAKRIANMVSAFLETND